MNSISFYRYRLPLTQPLRFGKQTVSEREGILLHAVRQGQPRWADAAPLPGFSRESVEQVIQAARDGDWGRYPSLQFARASLDAEPCAGRVPINRLLWGDEPSILQQLPTLDALPHRTLKLKVARGPSVANDIRLVRAVCSSLRPDQRLRLDANRGWTFDEAARFADAVADCPIDYVEEPTGVPAEFERLVDQHGLPYALDETLREPGDLASFPQAAAWVIKPTLMGDFQRARWVASSPPLVFSAAFESGVGLWQIACLAHQHAPENAAGLDTYRWLSEDLVEPRLDLEGAEFELQSAWSVDTRRLEAIPL